MKNILLIVDPQNDFINGNLAVEGAKSKMKKLATYIYSKGTSYDYICITLDSHPENHCSFKKQNGLWPKHCVLYSEGWDIPGYLDSALKTHNRVSFYHKGTNTTIEEYSIFENNEDGNTLTRQIKELLQEDEVYIDICGIAGDYCVLETIKDLRKLIGDNYISVLEEYTASIDNGVTLTNYLTENEMNLIHDSYLNLTEYVH